MQTVSVEHSVAMIPDGATLMIGGFMAVGTPERAIDEIMRQKKRDLTLITNDTAVPGRGVGKIIGAKLARKIIVSQRQTRDRGDATHRQGRDEDRQEVPAARDVVTPDRNGCDRNGGDRLP